MPEEDMVCPDVCKANGEEDKGSGEEEKRRWCLTDFEMGKPLGRGKFGNVYLARQPESGAVVALKVLSKASMCIEGAEFLVRREIEIQSRLNHPHILRMLGWFHNEKSVFLILEHAPNGEVFRELQQSQTRGLGEALARRYIAQLLSALGCLHRAGVIHRDVKPENLLLTGGGDVKLADFGAAIHAPEPFHLRNTLCGTPEYLAPEVLEGKGYSYEVDVWAVGVLAFELLFGRTPFTSVQDRTLEPERRNEQIYQRILGFDNRRDLSPLPRENPFAFTGRCRNSSEGPKTQLPCSAVSSAAGPAAGSQEALKEFAQLIRALMARDPATRPTPAEASQQFDWLR